MMHYPPQPFLTGKVQVAHVQQCPHRPGPTIQAILKARDEWRKRKDAEMPAVRVGKK